MPARLASPTWLANFFGALSRTRNNIGASRPVNRRFREGSMRNFPLPASRVSLPLLVRANLPGRYDARQNFSVGYFTSSRATPFMGRALLLSERFLK